MGGWRCWVLVRTVGAEGEGFRPRRGSKDKGARLFGAVGGGDSRAARGALRAQMRGQGSADSMVLGGLVRGLRPPHGALCACVVLWHVAMRVPGVWDTAHGWAWSVTAQPGSMEHPCKVMCNWNNAEGQ